MEGTLPMANEEVKLLGTLMCPFVLGVKWAMKLKGVEYEFIEEDLTNKSDLLLKYNPANKKVPVLVHDGKPICESLVILEYVDETWRQNPIMPEDVYEKSMARFWSRFGDEKCFPPIWQAFTSNGKVQEEAILSATEHLKILERNLEGKKFFGGEKLNFTDLSLGWIAYVVRTFEEIIELKMIEGEKFPLLSKWITNFSGITEVKDHLPPPERTLAEFRTIHEVLSAPKGND